MRGKTAPMLLCERARLEPDATAFRVRRNGTEIVRTWRDYAGMVARTAKALEMLGVLAGDRVAIFADTCEEWIVCDVAAQSLGAIVFGIYPTSSTPEIEYQLCQGTPTVVFAGTTDQVDRIVPALERISSVKAVIVFDRAGVAVRQHRLLGSFDALVSVAGLADLADLEYRARRIAPAAPAFIVFTSGTTGNPKGAIVAHGKHLAAAATFVDHYPLLQEVVRTTVVYLPPCHVLGRNVAITLPLISKLVPCFSDPKETLPKTLSAVRPAILFLVPRLLQKFAAQMITNEQNLGSIRRRAYRIAMAVALMRTKLNRRSSIHPLAECLYRICRRGVVAPILRRFGFDRLELVLSGGAPVPTAAMAFWHLCGVNVVQVYGTTESGGSLIAGQRGPFPPPGCVGTPPSGMEVRVDENGEILIRDPDVFEGYWSDDATTAAVRTADGWLRTGDVGRWENGELKLIDRARDFIVTSGGKTLSPCYIENVLRTSPYVAEVIVFGHARKYITALIEIDLEAVSNWAAANRVGHSEPGRLYASNRTLELLSAEVAKANTQLARVEQIKNFRILPRALQPGLDGEPVTATRKVRRQQMYLKYKDLVESMYDNDEERIIAADIGQNLSEVARTAA